LSRVVDGGGWREKGGKGALTKSKCQEESSTLVVQVSDPSLLHECVWWRIRTQHVQRHGQTQTRIMLQPAAGKMMK
jgi:hypothetical protein